MSESTIDRTVLPIRRPPFGGETKRTLADSTPDWSQASHVQPPKDAPNVLLVLIDDAGFGNPSTFGGPIQTPNYTRLAENGLRYNRFHVTALCSPTRAALLTGRNHHRVGFGMVGEFSGPFPGYNATVPRDCAPFPRILQENGYLTGGFGKWHLTPDNQQGFSGPFDRWPTRLGFDYFWGFLGGEAGQYDPLIAENQKIIGVPEAKDGEELLLPGRPGRQDDRLAAQGPLREAEDAVVRLRRDRLQPRAAPGAARVVGQVPRRVRQGLGRDARGDVRAPEGARRRPGRRGAVAAQRRVPDLGLARRDAQAPLRPPDGGLRGLLRERRLEHRPDHRRDRRDGRAREHGRDLDLGRQRREHGGNAHRHVQRADDAERDPAHARAADRAALQARRPRGLGRRAARAALRGRLGLGRQRPVRLGQAGRLAPRRHAQPDGRALAGRHRRRGRGPQPLHARERRRRDGPRPRRHPDARHDRRHRAAAVRRRAPSPTRSRTRRRRSGTRSSTTRSSATAGCTRTAGCSRSGCRGSRGTSTRRSCARSARAGIPTTTRSSSTTCPTTSRSRRTSPPSIRRR